MYLIELLARCKMRMNKKTIAILFSIILCFCFSACNKQEDNTVVPQTVIDYESKDSKESGESPTETISESTTESTADIKNVLLNNSDTVTEQKIRISVGGQSFTAILADTKAAEEFAALLPLTMNMSELNGNEKYYYLNETLTTDSKVPDMIHTGDIMLFGSSCIVLFYEDFSTSYSYTPIANIEDTNGLESALGSGNVTISFS